QQDGFEFLGDLPGGRVFTLAEGISGEGSTIVGFAGSYDSSGNEAFRWDQTSGMVGLGFLPNKAANSEAISVTPDGSVIVGLSGDNDNAAAFVWDAAHGMRSLQGLLNADPNLVGNLTGWSLQLASAISADGKAIV